MNGEHSLEERMLWNVEEYYYQDLFHDDLLFIISFHGLIINYYHDKLLSSQRQSP